MRADDILDDKLGQVDVLVLIDFFDRFCVVFRCLFAHLFSLGACTNHFSTCKNKCCSFGVSYTHDCGCKALRFVLNVFAPKSDQFEV